MVQRSSLRRLAPPLALVAACGGPGATDAGDAARADVLMRADANVRDAPTAIDATDDAATDLDAARPTDDATPMDDVAIDDAPPPPPDVPAPPPDVPSAGDGCSGAPLPVGEPLAIGLADSNGNLFSNPGLVLRDRDSATMAGCV